MIDRIVSGTFFSPSLALFIVSFILFIRFLRILSNNEKPQLYFFENTTNGKKSEIKLSDVLDNCSILKTKYVPPRIWGRNGHLQTAVYGILGHSLLKRVSNKRHFVELSDGTTVTFDVYEPIKQHFCNGDYTLLLCPGIANSSESNYIRTCVHNAQENGYRCAILNHLGALLTVKLTTNHIFSYGGTAEFHAMYDLLRKTYPSTKFLVIGFSMGGNIATRFLNEIDETERQHILLGISVCQAYSATASTAYYHDWENGRRVYNYVITENMKRLLRRNYEKAVAPHVNSGLVDEERIWSCTSILALDEYYSRRVHGFDSINDYYNSASCLPVIHKIKTPIIFVNSMDDPLVPEPLWEKVQTLCLQPTNPHAFLLLKHGGHLGFLEGGALKPNSVSWLDRFIVEVANSATKNV